MFQRRVDFYGIFISLFLPSVSRPSKVGVGKMMVCTVCVPFQSVLAFFFSSLFPISTMAATALVSYAKKKKDLPSHTQLSCRAFVGKADLELEIHIEV